MAGPLRKRTARIKSLALSFHMSLSYYNVYAATTCSHVLQYRPVDSHLRAAESACLASVTASPMNALSRDCLANLGLIGIRPQVQSMDTTSLVARGRVAMTCSSLQRATNVLEEALDSPIVLFVHRADEPPWLFLV